MTERMRAYVLNKFRQEIPDNGTGLGLALLKASVEAEARRRPDEPHALTKARLFRLVLEKMRIESVRTTGIRPLAHGAGLTVL